MAIAMIDGGGGAVTTNLLSGLVGDISTAINKAASGSPEFALSPATVAKVRANLIQAQESLDEAQALMPAIPASGVGGSPWGAELSHHSKLVHTRLLETIKEMITGLGGFETGIDDAYKGMGVADETSVDEFSNALNCVGGPTTTSPLPMCQG